MKFFSTLFILISLLVCQSWLNKKEITLNAAEGLKSPTTNEIEHFEKGLEQLIDHYKISGLSVILIQNDQPVYKKGFGYADIKNQIPATSNTPYRIASLTKPIATTILLQLKEKEKLALSDTMKNNYPGYEAYFSSVKNYVLKHKKKWTGWIENYDYERDDITIWHHLTHTSEGIPGTFYKYNGFLFGKLSVVLEYKTGEQFDKLLEENIFIPCEMGNSIASQSHENKPNVLSSLAKPYKVVNKKFRESNYPTKNVNAGAGIISSVEDLAKFDKAINMDQLIRKSTKEMAWQNQINNEGEQIPYGLGWFVQEINNTKIVWHYGWQPDAYSGLYIKIPKKNRTMILLSNCDNLSSPFPKLGKEGDIRKSAFANLYLDIFNK